MSISEKDYRAMLAKTSGEIAKQGGDATCIPAPVEREEDTARSMGTSSPAPVVRKAGAGTNPNWPYRSKTEANYAAYLGLLQKAGEIMDWRYEIVTFKLARGVRYTPDFFVDYWDRHEWHEVKGRKGKTFWSRPVSKIKVRLAATMFPWWEFKVVWPRKGGGWDSEEVRS